MTDRADVLLRMVAMAKVSFILEYEERHIHADGQGVWFVEDGFYEPGKACDHPTDALFAAIEQHWSRNG